MVDQTGFPNTGIDLVADFFANNAPNPPQTIEFGTGATPTTPSTTQLETPTGFGPHPIDAYAKIGVGKASLVVNLGLTEENNKSLTEIAAYDGPSGDGVDTMYLRRTGAPLFKTNNMIVRAEIQIEAIDRSIVS